MVNLEQLGTVCARVHARTAEKSKTVHDVSGSTSLNEYIMTNIIFVAFRLFGPSVSAGSHFFFCSAGSLMKSSNLISHISSEM